MTIPFRSLAVALRLVLLLPCALVAQDRQLSWPVVSITAHLDSSGALTFQERQTIRLSGDWNGIERNFNLRNTQSLVLRSLSRIAVASGEAIHLREDSDIDDIDEYAWVNNGSTLRWRARLSTDPAFNDTTLVYQIDAVYDRILITNADGSYQLDHNFAMIDREGSIDSFELTLTLDSAWIAPAGFTGRFQPGALPPGTGYLVNLNLRYSGAGRPANVRFGADDNTRTALFSLLAAAALLFFIRLVLRERSLGRFAPVPDPASITAEWLEHHLFSMLPEVAGALWDDNTSAPEVAAILARLVQEGKLTNRVETSKVLWISKQELHLTLEVDRAELAPHERALIDALFEGSARTTSTSQVRERYKSTGFDPASTIKKQLDTMVGTVASGGSKPSWKPTGLLLLAGLIAVIIGITTEKADAPAAIVTLGISIPVFLIPMGFALGAQRSLESLGFALLLLAIVLGAYIGIIARIILLVPVDALGAITCTGITLWAIGLARSLTNIASSRQSPERIAQRKRLYAARELFRRELRNARPALKDEWFPYIIAFGLASQADRWFKAFGGMHDASSAVLVGQAASRGSGASGSSGSGWSGFGGGGGFSGGGSSASFAAAVGGMAASVPSPSSSSSGGGSSSSGGSSGGGGGGGW